ncbi:UDP-glucose 4-epimerase [Leifsonia xyli subsp. xyli]|uniref:UDP-glucose 4-epimerase n=2 Tax=Leifsonia xyli subsp. xyli TaxID=59736 RepID=Q6AGK7_LEIXX|nr:polysaccharide biosynthesis protein [Leifsonia xyli]AAT88488.1 polysaccharide biosynthesis protein [Leifsonia xyli subsp. xyli str. CTCB07]ODA91033.1 UDP-glucose 4-epimerase [Leifsonia xyli subsp. xyli]
MTERKIEGSIVTVTGGTGSFGSTMARHLLSRDVGEIRIFSRDESKQDALRHEVNDPRMRFYIGDVRDSLSVTRAIKGSDHVFHAAALKQVPSGEFFPLEVVATNITGSGNVIRAAIEHQAKSVVCLSTDKAVYPINAMGMTKALMEKTAFAMARENLDTETVVSVTRYGNVMYSRGSVIPLFIKQLTTGQNVTVTDPEMTRFLMSLAQSVDLVEYAFTQATSGDLFVRKAPASTVAVLLEAVANVIGVPMPDVDIIGVRHGEKLYESLLGSEEMAKAEDRGDYFRVPLNTRSLDYTPYFEEGADHGAPTESYTSHNTERLDVAGVERLLLTLPEIQQMRAQLR